MPATQADPAQQLADKISEISSLPDTATRIIQAVQDPNSGAHDLMKVLQADPSLTARVLRTINSAAYGLSERVTDLQKAISYLGFNQIRNLALTASISEIFKDGKQIGPYTRSTLWRHMVGVAIAARMVSRRLELPNPEESFLAGLLHDVGIILIDQYAHPKFVTVMMSLERGPADQTPSLVATERELLGFDHTQIGELLAKSWRFPDALVAAIRYHHAAGGGRTEHKLLVQCVQAANTICTLKGMSSIGLKSFDCTAEVFRDLGFSKTDVKVLVGDLDEEVRQNSALFELL